MTIIIIKKVITIIKIMIIIIITIIIFKAIKLTERHPYDHMISKLHKSPFDLNHLEKKYLTNPPKKVPSVK